MSGFHSWSVGSQGLASSMSLPVLFTAHTACLAGLGWLQSTGVTALSCHQIVVTSPKFWGLCCNWTVTSLTKSPRLSSGTLALPQGTKPKSWGFYCNWGYTFTNGLSEYQVSPDLHNPFMPPSPPPTPCDASLPSTAVIALGPQFLCANTKETLSRMFCLHDVGFFLNTTDSLVPTNQNQFPAQQGFTLQYWFPANTVNSSDP